MTVEEMLKLTKRFKEMERCDSSIKDVRLANMMADMEIAYNKELSEMNSFAFAMYRTVSEARSLQKGDEHDWYSCSAS